MRVLNEREYGLFERLVSLSQQELHKTLGVYLKGKYKNIIIEKEYIVAIGDIPIALVAHLDTVFYNSVEEMYYDQKKGILWSPQGLGADDRAGIFAILQIIQSGLRPSIILTTDEERGGLGAQKLSKKPCPISNLKYLIQLDRKGTNDCVFYDCLNPQFMKYIEEFGFVEKVGSFSDISFLMPAWQICGVNLSVGYYDEHSVAETLNINSLFRTIDIVCKMLKEENIPSFEYKEVSNVFDYNAVNYPYFYNDEDYDTTIPCSGCKKHFFEFELIPIKGHKPKQYCPDCAVDKVNWCSNCGTSYEIIDLDDDMELCPECVEVLTSAKNN